MSLEVSNQPAFSYFEKLTPQNTDPLILKISKIVFSLMTLGFNLLIAKSLDAFSKKIDLNKSKPIFRNLKTDKSTNYKKVISISFISLIALGIASYTFTKKNLKIINPKIDRDNTKHQRSLNERSLNEGRSLDISNNPTPDIKPSANNELPIKDLNNKTAHLPSEIITPRKYSLSKFSDYAESTNTNNKIIKFFLSYFTISYNVNTPNNVQKITKLLIGLPLEIFLSFSTNEKMVLIPLILLECLSISYLFNTCTNIGKKILKKD